MLGNHKLLWAQTVLTEMRLTTISLGMTQWIPEENVNRTAIEWNTTSSLLLA